MFSSPMKNLNNFIKENPPIVIFLLCLISLTLASFSFAFYIQHEEPVTNTDLEYDWEKILKHFNKLDYCLNKGKPEDVVEDSDFVEEAFVETPIEIGDVRKFKGVTRVKALLSLEDWWPTCRKNNDKPNYLQVYFTIPEDLTRKNVCGIVRGPREYLPKYSTPHCHSDRKSFNKLNFDGLITTFYNNRRLRKASLFCQNGVGVNLEFNLDGISENYASYLTQEDRNNIYLHLMWLSYLLTICVLGIIIYAVFHRSKSEEKNSLFYTRNS